LKQSGDCLEVTSQGETMISLKAKRRDPSLESSILFSEFSRGGVDRHKIDERSPEITQNDGVVIVALNGFLYVYPLLNVMNIIDEIENNRQLFRNSLK